LFRVAGAGTGQIIADVDVDALGVAGHLGCLGSIHEAAAEKDYD